MWVRAPRRQSAPGPEPARRSTYYPDTAPVFIEAAANVVNSNYLIRAELQVPDGGGHGMVLAHGGRFGGYGLLVFDGRPRFVYNYLGVAATVIASDRPMPAGSCTLAVSFEMTGKPDAANRYGAPGVARLFIDQQVVASTALVKTAPVMLDFSGTLTCGYHPAEPFGGYEPPFRYTGEIRCVDVWTHGSLPVHEALATEVYLKRQ